MNIFAHATSEHTDQTSTIEHWLTTPWLYGLLLTMIAVLVLSVLHITKASLALKVLCISGVLLVGGMFGFIASPIIGVTAIALGSLMCIVVVLAGLI